MPSIDLPKILGERAPAATKARPKIRAALLKRRSLLPTDLTGIQNCILSLVREARTLAGELEQYGKDEQKRRRCLALLTEAAYLASDEKLALRWRNQCIKVLGLTGHVPPLLPVTLRAYGPYRHDGDDRRAISRDYRAILRSASLEVLPPDLVEFWNQPGHGLDIMSRP